VCNVAVYFLKLRRMVAKVFRSSTTGYHLAYGRAEIVRLLAITKVRIIVQVNSTQSITWAARCMNEMDLVTDCS
jgi:hypothetical protein